MKGFEMRKRIVAILENSKEPLTFNEVAEGVGIADRDGIALHAELGTLTRIGSIKAIRKQYGGTEYTV